MPPSADDPASNKNKKPGTILFDVSKKEYFGPTAGFKKLNRKLKTQYKIQTYVPNILVQKHAINFI